MQKRFFSLNTQAYKNLLQDNSKKVVVAIGPAGTGKTMMACEESIFQLKQQSIKKIVITRPIVGADNDIGFLPGNIDDKMAPWTRPIFDVFYEHFTKSRVIQMMKNDIIEVSPLVYMRGRTFKNCYIIGDELQNSTILQMKMLLTRLGDNSRMFINGDLEQQDLIGKNGLEHFLKLIKEKGDQEEIGIIEMNNSDVKRSSIVQKIIELYQ